MIFNWIARLIFQIYFVFLRVVLRLMATPQACQIFREKHEFSRLFICFGFLTPLQRKTIERRFNRYRSFFWGDWNLIFVSDLPLIQQTINLGWFHFEARPMEIPGLQPSRTDQDRVEMAVFLLKKLKQDDREITKPSRRVFARWKEYFSGLQIQLDHQMSIPDTVFLFLSSVLGLDASERLTFIQFQRQILAGDWNQKEPWAAAPILKARPEIWCWWLAQFPFDWAEVPPWTAIQKKILFAEARWEIARGLLQDWKVMGFADEFKRMELFFNKSFAENEDAEFQLIQKQLQEAREILTTKDLSIVPH